MPVHVVVELQLEAVPVCGRVGGYGGKAGVPLWAYAYTIKGLAVDYHITAIIFLGSSVVQHLVPVILANHDIDTDNLAGVEQDRFVLHSQALIVAIRCELVRKYRSSQTEAYGQHHNGYYDFCRMFMCNHMIRKRAGIPASPAGSIKTTGKNGVPPTPSAGKL